MYLGVLKMTQIGDDDPLMNDEGDIAKDVEGAAALESIKQAKALRACLVSEVVVLEARIDIGAFN